MKIIKTYKDKEEWVEAIKNELVYIANTQDLDSQKLIFSIKELINKL